MRQSKLALSLVTLAILAGCGGSNNNGAGDQAPKLRYSAQVSFGDSLSDVGSYAVGGVAALKGGKFTVNDVGSNGVNAAKIGLN